MVCENCKVFASYGKNFTFCSVLNTVHQSSMKKFARSLSKFSHFTWRISHFTAFWTHTNWLIIDKKYACETCKVFAFYARNFTFHSVLNTLYQSLIKNLCVKYARSVHFAWKIFHFTAFWTRSTNHQLKIWGWKMQGLCFLCKEFHFLQCS